MIISKRIPRPWLLRLQLTAKLRPQSSSADGRHLRMYIHHSFNRVFALTTFTHRKPHIAVGGTAFIFLINVVHHQMRKSHLGKRNQHQKIEKGIMFCIIILLHIKLPGKEDQQIPVEEDHHQMRKSHLGKRNQHQKTEKGIMFCIIILLHIKLPGKEDQQIPVEEDPDVTDEIGEDPSIDATQGIHASDTPTQRRSKNAHRQQIPDYFIQQHDPATRIGHQQKNFLTVYLFCNH